MGFRGGVRRREPSLTWNISRQIKDPVIIYVREHRFAWHIACHNGPDDGATHLDYIGIQGLANEIWQISRQNSPDNRPSGALSQRARPGTLIQTLMEAPHGCRG